MPQVAFDTIAPVYDSTFTETAVGKLQREVVWDYLKQQFSHKKLNILEINCGTGTDAAFLGEMGHKVTSTDASAEMILQAKQKYNSAEINFENVAFDKLSDHYSNEKFDLIFSNFGGLNCVSPEVLQHLLSELKNLLKTEGRIVAVVMGKFCMLESVYFLYKMNLKESFRRSRNAPVVADVGGEKVITWYYSPGTFFDMAGNGFKQKNVKPVGLFIPPSYLNSFYEKKPKLLSISKKVDELLAPLPFTSNFSDHYLIDLVLK